MKISIWDLDFYHKKSFLPNPTLMKISSFHKQQGHLINFVSNEFEINMSFDIFYIAREKEITPKAPRKLIDHPNSRLIGRPMRFFDNFWKPDMVISATRPDYLLYPEMNKRSAYYNAHIVQYYFEGEKIPKIQPFKNTAAHHKKTLVIDSEKDFWETTRENLILTLTELKDYPNIAFLNGIPLRRIMEDDEIKKLFTQLEWSPGTVFKFRNNYGQSTTHAQNLFDFINHLRSKKRNVKFTFIPFMAVTLDHWKDRENAMFDLERCFRLMDLAKKNGVSIRIVSPQNRFQSPYWYYFETFEVCTTYFERLSYVESMTHSAAKKYDVPWYDILNDSLKWITPNVNYLLKLLTKTTLIDRFGFRRWKDEFIDKSLIDQNEIKKFEGIENNSLSQD